MQDTNQFTSNYNNNQTAPTNYQSQNYSSQAGNNSPNPQPQYPYNQQNYGYGYQSITQMDIENKKNGAKTLGILSIIFGFFIPIVGLILGIIANSKEKILKAMNIETSKLGLIGIIVSISMWIFNIITLIIAACLS